MAEQQGAVRTNISLPRGLKARMDEVQESVNWSAVAATAFEAKLLELASRKETVNMDDVIARLKAAEEMDRKQDYQEGRAAGLEWAQTAARPKELRRLALLDEDRHMNIAGYLDQWEEATGGIALQLQISLAPEEARISDSGVWWDAVLGDDADRIHEPAFARGFIEGALDLWRKVRQKV